MNWQPIDTAPKDRPILLTVAGPSNYWPIIAQWDEEHQKWQKYVTDDGKRVTVEMKLTHWMELPESPLR